MEGHPIQKKNRLLFRDSRKRIWIGGEKGLSVYNQVGMALQANTDFRITPVLQQSFVNCIYESLSGSIWVGTRDGLFALKEADKELQQSVHIRELFSNASCQRILRLMTSVMHRNISVSPLFFMDCSVRWTVSDLIVWREMCACRRKAVSPCLIIGNLC